MLNLEEVMGIHAVYTLRKLGEDHIEEEDWFCFQDQLVAISMGWVDR